MAAIHTHKSKGYEYNIIGIDWGKVDATGKPLGSKGFRPAVFSDTNPGFVNIFALVCQLTPFLAVLPISLIFALAGPAIQIATGVAIISFIVGAPILYLAAYLNRRADEKKYNELFPDGKHVIKYTKDGKAKTKTIILDYESYCCFANSIEQLLAQYHNKMQMGVSKNDPAQFCLETFKITDPNKTPESITLRKLDYDDNEYSVTILIREGLQEGLSPNINKLSNLYHNNYEKDVQSTDYHHPKRSLASKSRLDKLFEASFQDADIKSFKGIKSFKDFKKSIKENHSTNIEKKRVINQRHSAPTIK